MRMEEMGRDRDHERGERRMGRETGRDRQRDRRPDLQRGRDVRGKRDTDQDID